jgi:hypothetical protein
MLDIEIIKEVFGTQGITSSLVSSVPMYELRRSTIQIPNFHDELNHAIAYTPGADAIIRFTKLINGLIEKHGPTLEIQPDCTGGIYRAVTYETDDQMRTRLLRVKATYVDSAKEKKLTEVEKRKATYLKLKAEFEGSEL